MGVNVLYILEPLTGPYLRREKKVLPAPMSRINLSIARSPGLSMYQTERKCDRGHGHLDFTDQLNFLTKSRVMEVRLSTVVLQSTMSITSFI